MNFLNKVRSTYEHNKALVPTPNKHLSITFGGREDIIVMYIGYIWLLATLHLR